MVLPLVSEASFPQHHSNEFYLSMPLLKNSLVPHRVSAEALIELSLV